MWKIKKKPAVTNAPILGNEIVAMSCVTFVKKHKHLLMDMRCDWYNKDLRVEFGELAAQEGFIFVGMGSTRVALKIDNVVYKVNYNGDRYQVSNENNLFSRIKDEGRPWTPDFYYFAKLGVMAMHHYELVDSNIR